MSKGSPQYSLIEGVSCCRSLRERGPLVVNLRQGAWWKEFWRTDLSSFKRFVINFVGRVNKSKIQAPTHFERH